AIRIAIGQTIPARATTEAVFAGNLNAVAGVPVGHVVRYTISDVDGSGLDVTLELTKISDTEWDIVAKDSDGKPLELASDSLKRLQFDERGVLTNIADIAILDPSDSSQTITL